MTFASIQVYSLNDCMSFFESWFHKLWFVASLQIKVCDCEIILRIIIDPNGKGLGKLQSHFIVKNAIIAKQGL